MRPRPLQRDDKSFVPVLYMAMELSHRNWKLLFGDGARRCQLSIVAGGHASAQIPGVSGANLASFGDADSIVQAVEKSGLRRLS